MNHGQFLSDDTCHCMHAHAHDEPETCVAGMDDEVTVALTRAEIDSLVWILGDILTGGGGDIADIFTSEPFRSDPCIDAWIANLYSAHAKLMPGTNPPTPAETADGLRDLLSKLK